MIGQKCQFFLKNGIFLLQNILKSDFLAWIRNQRFRIDPCAKFSSIGQKIKEREFWPWMIPKIAWWFLSYLIVMTSANFLKLLRDFVSEYHHAKFGCNQTTNKGETEGHNVPPPSQPILFQDTPAWTGLSQEKQNCNQLLSCAKVKSPCHTLEELKRHKLYIRINLKSCPRFWNMGWISFSMILLTNLALESPARIKKSPFRHM